MSSNVVGRHIVAAVDGSPSALRAARWAADEAARQRMPLRLVHAVNMAAIAYSGAYVLPADFFESLQSAGQTYLADAESALHAAHPELEITSHLVDGSPIPVLVDESATAYLVALGSRGLGGFSGMLTGSTAVATVAHGHCPVAVIRGEPDAPLPSTGPVVVGVDGSPSSTAAIPLAYEAASRRGVDLVAVHAWTEFTSDSAYLYARQFVVDWDAVDARQHEQLAERLAGYQEKYPDVTVRRVVEGGRPSRLLLEHAKGAQLLVVGSRGHSEFGGALLGSTSQAMIYHAPCPVMVVRPNEA